MWRVSWRDMQWRRRRFLIAGTGATLVFAMALLISGLSESFRVEARNSIGAIGGDWVLPAGIDGPATSQASLPAGLAAALRTTRGVRAAVPVVVVRQVVRHPRPDDVMLVGYAPGDRKRLGVPPVREGRLPQRENELVVDQSLGARVGDSIRMGSRSMTVVGRTSGLTLLAGIPLVFAPIETAQAVAFASQPSATAILVEGEPSALPAGTHLVSAAGVRADALSPLRDAIDAIDMLRILLWLVAALIVGSIVYLSALERTRDFAVLKATGASSRDLLLGLAGQAVVLSVLSAVVAAAVAQLLVPAFPLPVRISGGATAALPAVAVAVGLLASLGGARRAITTDPALAFGAG